MQPGAEEHADQWMGSSGKAYIHNFLSPGRLVCQVAISRYVRLDTLRRLRAGRHTNTTFADQKKKIQTKVIKGSVAGNRTRVSWVRAMCPNRLDYDGMMTSQFFSHPYYPYFQVKGQTSLAHYQQPVAPGFHKPGRDEQAQTP